MIERGGRCIVRFESIQSGVEEEEEEKEEKEEEEEIEIELLAGHR